MRHRKKKRRLGRTTAHRKATLRNIARALLINQKIKTTKIKAKETKVFVDKLITIGKNNTPYYQRLAFSLIPDKKVIKELFKEIAPRFKNRSGGYTRIIPLNFRKGDGADMAILELTEQKIIAKPKAKAKKTPLKEKSKELPPKKVEEKPPEHKVTPKPKAEVAEGIAKEKAKTEKKKIEKGILKGLRRFFRGRTP